MSFPPVFIGNFRSGTTLLANLLSFHSELSPWFETKGLCELFRWLRVLKAPSLIDYESKLVQPKSIDGFNVDAVRERIRYDLMSTEDRLRGAISNGKAGYEVYPAGFDCINYTFSEADEILSSWYDRVVSSLSLSEIYFASEDLVRTLGQLHASKSGKLIWINKTPELPRFTNELRECLGNCRVILMIRDGRDVVHSATQLGWESPMIIADWWKGMIVETRSQNSTSPELYLEVRYEDLLENTAFVLDQVLRFLEVEQNSLQIIEEYNKHIVSLCDNGRPSLPQVKQTRGSRLARDTDRYVDPELLRSLGYL